MAHHRQSRLATVCLVALAMSCDPAPVDHLSWTPLTEQEVKDRLASPTGPLFEASHQELVSQVRDRLPVLLETTRFLAQVVHVVSEVSATDYSEQEARLPNIEQGPSPTARETWGSSFYLRLACWGKEPLKSPVKDFTAGEVRLDSPELTSLNLESLVSGGEFLLSFRQCELGPMLLEAALAGRYMSDLSRLGSVGGEDAPPTVGIALSADTVDYQGNSGTLGLIALGCGGAGACGDDIRMVAELKTAAGSYLVSFRVLSGYWTQPDALAVTIRGKNSEATCSFVYGTKYANPTLTCSGS